MPVSFLKKTPATCSAVPEPVVPWVALSPLAFIQATSSFRSLAGMDLRATMSSGLVPTSPTGSKSPTTSYLRL